MKTRSAILLSALLSVSAFAGAATSRRVDPALYGPIPEAMKQAIFREAGLTKPAEQAIFEVIRIIPLELGGTNVPKNLALIARDRLAEHAKFQAIILEQVTVGKMKPRDAVQAMLKFPF